MASHHRYFEVNSPFEKVMQQAPQALLRINASITYIDENNKAILAKKSTSMLSWGENIRISVVPTAAGSMVDVTSESVVPITLIDWGINAKNVNEFERWLRVLLG